MDAGRDQKIAVLDALEDLEAFSAQPADPHPHSAGDALAALIECTLETGRTHQIRAHLSHIGHPLIGDQVYGRGPGLSGLKPGEPEADRAIKTIKKFRRQALHAKVLGFTHPITGEELRFECDPPEDFQNLKAALRAL